METDEDGGNLHVEPEPAFDSIPEAQPAHTVISHLAQTPDLTTEIAFTSDTVQA
ncbi:hypothetical protein [Alicyclobacillus macrosporangiidus]|uniref:hypothetical protein n=1 Tax=Alicyclobacillus macrosporangiidus TaxID=392015 RepID=UPI000AA8281A|nr:hypothetical protein [Alicyclobacillus macrosporangiidus]